MTNHSDIDERTLKEFEAGIPIRTVGELIEKLSKLPADTPVAVDGYEMGYSGIESFQLIPLQEMSGLADYAGRFLPPEDAADEVAGDGYSGWERTISKRAPTIVGDPVTTIVLGRER